MKVRADVLVQRRGLAESRSRAQALILAGKVRALTLGRFNVAIEDLRALALPALRHRIILNFEGEAEGTDADDVLRAAMQEIEAPDLPAGQREAR